MENLDLIRKGEFTYVNQLISSVVDCALMSDSTNCNILGF